MLLDGESGCRAKRVGAALVGRVGWLVGWGAAFPILVHVCALVRRSNVGSVNREPASKQISAGRTLTGIAIKVFVDPRQCFR